MQCAIMSSLNSYLGDLAREDALTRAREAYAEESKGEHLNDVYFVTENMADFICQNEELGALWMSGNYEKFCQDIKAHLDWQAYKAALDTAASMNERDFQEVDGPDSDDYH